MPGAIVAVRGARHCPPALNESANRLFGPVPDHRSP
jgi:hypothetical protein